MPSISTCTVTGNVANLLNAAVANCTLKVSVLTPFFHPTTGTWISGELESVVTDASGAFTVTVIETATPGVKVAFTFEYYDGVANRRTKQYNVIVPNQASALLSDLVTAITASMSVPTFPAAQVTVSAVTGLAATNAQAAIAELRSDITAIAASGVNYTNPGTAGVPRTVAAWISDRSVSVKDFGAVGNGTTDDTAAINAAITAASAAGGGTVYFPKSTAGYLVSSTITIPNNVALSGMTRDNSVIKAAASFTGASVLGTTAINTSIRDLIVNCNSVGNLNGIFVNSSGALQMDIARVKVIGLAKAAPWTNTGIYVKGFNVQIEDIEIDGGVIYGVQLNGASDVFASDILCVNSDIGIALYGCEQVTLENLQLDSCNSNYVAVDTSHDVSFSGVHCFFNASVYTAATSQVGILIGQGSTTYTGSNLNSDIQFSNVTLRNFGLNTVNDIGINLIACENLVMANVSIANTSMNYSAGGTIGVGLKYSQGSNSLTGVISNLNISGVATAKSGTAPTSGWVILSDATSASTANALMRRDSNQNVAINNINEAFATTVTAAGTTTLTVASAPLQQFTGTTTQNVALPAATTLLTGCQFQIFNRSTGIVTVKDGGGTTLRAMAAGSQLVLTCAANGTAAGTWDLSYTIGAASALPIASGGTGQTTATAAFDALSPMTTKGDIISRSGTGNTRVGVGADGTVLTADSTQTAGVKWGTVLTNPMTAAGDMIAGGSSGTPARVAAVASAGQVPITGASGTSVAFGTLPGNATVLKGLTVQKFLTGSGTYTTPTSPAPLYIKVRMVGGGGGGGGSTSSAFNAGTGGTGGNTTFGITLLVANGGTGGGANTNRGGAGGTASLGTGPIGIALSGATGGDAGNAGTANIPGGAGGSSPFGGAGASSAPGGAAVANTGSGGGGPENPATGGGAGSGGGAGGFVDAIINAPSATYAYAVGSGGTAGTAGTSGTAGGAGGSGIILVEEYYQ